MDRKFPNRWLDGHREYILALALLEAGRKEEGREESLIPIDRELECELEPSLVCGSELLK